MIQRTPTNTAADIREEWAAGGPWLARIEAVTGHQWACLAASIRRQSEIQPRSDLAHAVGINHVLDGTAECTCVTKPQIQHFAIGLVVRIREGAKPVGWDEDEPGPDDVDFSARRGITAVWPSEPEAPLGSFEVQGWNWSPTDLTVAQF